MSRINDRAPRLLAQGSRMPGRFGKRIVIAFDDITFDQIAQMANSRRVSFGTVARELVEFGLLDLEEGRRA